MMVGLLTLIMLLAVWFATFIRIEKGRTRAGIFEIRSALLARTGVEYAAARMAQTSSSFAPGPADDWRYREDELLPLEKALNPSFHAGEPWDDGPFPDGRYDPSEDGWNPATQDLNLNGTYDGWSGLLRGSYSPWSDRFKLKIADPSGKISVNGNGSGMKGEPLLVDHDGDGRWDPAEPFTDRLVRVRDPEGEQVWRTHRRGEGADSQEIREVRGRYDPPNGTWDPGDTFTDWNGNGRRDVLEYRDLNGDNIWQEKEPVRRDHSDYWRADKDSSLEHHPNGHTLPNDWKVYKEPFQDTNGNEIFDPPEPFTDLNGNEKWDDEDEYEDLNENTIWDPSQRGLLNLLDAFGENLGLGNRFGREVLETGPYRSMADLKRRLGEGRYTAAAPFLTLYGTPDSGVIQPVGDRLAPAVNPQDTIRFQAAVNALWPVIQESRVPVSLNQAPQEVLQSVFLPLSARYLRRNCTYDSQGRHQVGTIEEAAIRPEAARTLAEAIVSSRESDGPLLSWNEFDRFLRKQVSEGEITPLEADLVFANANPNTRSNKFNPDALLVRTIDKSDLLGYTTEFTLAESGQFAVEALGLVEGANGYGIQGTRTVHAFLAFWETWNDRSQRDFASGIVASNSDPTGFATYRDRSVQIYPEPDTGRHGAAQWDGRIQPATTRVERIPGDEAGEESFVEAREQLLFYARYEDTLDGDYTGGGGRRTQYPATSEHWPNLDPALYSGRPNDSSLVHPSNPGSLYPDGVYSDLNNLPFYSMANSQDEFGPAGQNFESEAGMVSFWMKYNGDRDLFSPVQTYAGHSLLSFGYRPWHEDLEPDGSVRMMLGWNWVKGIGFVSEAQTSESGGDEAEIVAKRDLSMKKGVWFHVGGAWDLNQTEGEFSSAVHLNGDDGSDLYDNYVERQHFGVFDYTVDDGVNRRRFRLGERWYENSGDSKLRKANQPACSTIDEFCIYGRLGESGETTVEDWLTEGVQERSGHMENARVIWREQYQQGRYYNGGDGAYTSAPRLLPGSRFLKMRWSALIPPEPGSSSSGGGLPLDPLGGNGMIQFQNDPTEDLLAPPSDTSNVNWRVVVDFYDGERWLLAGEDGVLSPEEEEAARTSGRIDERGVPIDAEVKGNGQVQYRVYFREDADFNTPLLSAPAVEDVTLTYLPPDGPRVIHYFEE